jgi:prolyl oligopeptidase
MTYAEQRLEIEENDVVIDTCHGVKVQDPFRWLEDRHTSRTREWVGERSKESRSHLDGLPERSMLAGRVAEKLQRETYGDIYPCGETIYYVKRLATEEQGKLYRRKRTSRSG